MRPMLAARAGSVPDGPDWVHEVKWDGMRILLDVERGCTRCFSRTERDVTVAFPELAALGTLFDDMLLDGEVVAMVSGIPSFEALAQRFHVSDPGTAAVMAATTPVTFMAFDLLRLYGVDLTARTWRERRATLERLDLAGPHWAVPPTFPDGRTLFEATLAQGLEGVVSKRTTSRYLPGRRSDDWRKSAHRASRSVVIGGWRPEVGRAGRLGAVLVGVPGPHGLRYRGRVGSGLAGKAGEALLDELSRIATAETPFSDEVPREDSTGATWVAPIHVAEVSALGLSVAGRLRQPAYLGLRPDLDVAEVDVAEAGDDDA